ncbi:type I methionyl aminopeptidase [Candidatus Jorgensenbacteria bacterium]|nr:type I methionyl aminopeptidase [Candidatus Jorgensenbacteria bacterium]
MVKLKTERDLKSLRRSGNILALILQALEEYARPGVTLEDLDRLAQELLKKEKARSAFLGYRPERGSKAYPAAICTSVNEVVVHGVPTGYKLQNGDVLKIDIGVDYNGYFTDGAVTVGIGSIGEKIQKLIDVTRDALLKAIEVCLVGNRLGDIGWTVENTVRQGGLSVVRGLTGHGVGFALHEEPTVLNYGKRGEGLELKPGLVLAIEPMVSTGSPHIVQRPDDSYATSDGSISAHFEHTVAITDQGIQVLTQ